jgi:hypothetical protein
MRNRSTVGTAGILVMAWAYGGCAAEDLEPQPSSVSAGVGPNDPVSSSPIITANFTQLTQAPLGGSMIDGPVSAYPGGQYWLSSHFNHSGPGGGIKHALMSGNPDSPYNTVAWYKETCVRDPTTYYCVPGTLGAPAFTGFSGLTNVVELWFTNLYHPAGTTEYLAFIHEERVGFSGGVPGNQEGQTRIGLAWSTDGGNTWTYLGRIISPYGDPQPFNIQGTPYVIKDGYFYVYFVDLDAAGGGGVAVARANVDSVITAARAGTLGSNLWKKYKNGNWTSNALGGEPSFPTSPATMWGITHTQAARSSYDGKYYMPLTFMTWSGINTSVKLYQSTDGLSYTPFMTLVEEGATTQGPSSGYQYCSVVDVNGAGNAEVGQKFHVYCVKWANAPVVGSNAGLYRWTINLGPHGDYYRQSSDFSSAQGPRWLYRHGSSFTNMAWDATASVWRAANDSMDLITSQGFHPGTNENPALTWVAPKAGTVRISGTVRDGDPSCGDGGNASIVHNSTFLYGQDWANGNTVGVYSHDILRTVAPGDGLFFMVGKGPANSYCDYTLWDPSIEYQ